MRQKTKMDPLKKFIYVLRLNSGQGHLTSYAAELTFYILLAIIPLLLVFTNVLALLPTNPQEVAVTLKNILPSEVAQVVIPIVVSYLNHTSTGAFSLGLVFSLWPASQVFNTLQRVFHRIYKIERSKNFMFQRLFAYLFTWLIVMVALITSFIFMFGEYLITQLNQYLLINLNIVITLIQQGWFLASLVLFICLVLLYTYLPNNHRRWVDSIPGAVLAMVGFTLISRLFDLYINHFNPSASSNTALGVGIVILMWLYFNGIVLLAGAYVNVLVFDFKHISSDELLYRVKQQKNLQVHSIDFDPQWQYRPYLTGKLKPCGKKEF